MRTLLLTHQLPDGERRAARFSPCKQYRYTLDIIWDDDLPKVQFIGLNPSTADEFKDDNTVRKCKRFARMWGYGGMVMTNIFAFRSTDPRPMKNHPEPVGKGNDFDLLTNAYACQLTVAAWGNHGVHMGRYASVLRLFNNTVDLKCFRITKQNQPEHPLYMPYETKLIDYKPLLEAQGK